MTVVPFAAAVSALINRCTTLPLRGVEVGELDVDGELDQFPAVPPSGVHKPEYRDGNRGTCRSGVNHLCAVRAPAPPSAVVE